jgi:hypothetical protein
MRPEAILALFVASYSGWRLARLVVSGKRRILELTFWVYVYVWLGVTGFLQLATRRFPWPGAYDGEVVLGVILTVWVGLVSYELGLRMRVTDTLGSGWSVLRRRVQTGRTIALGMLAVGVAGALLWQVGGVGTILVSRVEFQRAFGQLGQGKAIGMAVHAGLTIPAFVSLLALWSLWCSRSRLRARERVAVGVFLVLLLGLNALVNNPLYSPRAWFGTIVLSLVFVAFRWWPGVSPSFWIGGLLLLFVVLFPYSDVFRHSTRPTFEFRLGEAVPQQLVGSGDYASFQQLLNARQYVGEEGLRGGRQMLATLFVWIPRQIWADKPVDTADLVATHAGYRYTNLEMPLWGELYVDWGLLGVVLGFFLYGWMTVFVQAVVERYAEARRTLGTLVVAILVGYQVLLLRGDLMSNFLWWLLIVAALFMVTGRTRSHQDDLSWH